MLATILLGACGGSEDTRESSASLASEGGHVHQVAVDPGDEALLIATHEGLFRAPGGAEEATRVGPVQDLMGFTVAGSGRFYASGHPAPGGSGPDHLGLIASSDGGRSWDEVSLSGRADFHALEYSGGKIVGYNGLTGELMLSANEGQAWQSEPAPAPILDIAIDPDDANHVVATSEAGLIERSGRGGWQRIGDRIGLLAWPKNGPLYIVEAGGAVSASEDGGSSWTPRGGLSDTPAALNAGGPSDLFAALEAGPVMASEDGGVTWATRLDP